MSAKNYNDHIALLKSREARPSFERTKAIIQLRDDESTASAIRAGQTRNWAIGIATFALFALIATRMVVNNSPNALLATKTPSKAAIISRSSQAVTQSDNSIAKTSLRGVPEGRSRGIEESNSLKPSRILGDRLVITSGLLAMTDDINTTLNNSPIGHSSNEDSLSVPLIENVLPRPINLTSKASNDIPMPLPLIIIPGKDNIPANRFFVSVSGSLSQELNSIAANSKYSFDEFIGIGYVISSRFSVGLVGGQENFVKKQPSYSTGFLDTNFVHNGIPYQNIIGHIDTGSTPQPTQIYSIGANLRYTFGDSYSSPYAEIFGGGSNEGAIAGATIGVSIFHFDMLSIDAGAFIRSLFSPTSSPLTKLGASLDLRYDL